MALREKSIMACSHVHPEGCNHPGETCPPPAHPGHLCPAPRRVTRWTEPGWKPPARPVPKAARAIRPLPPVVPARPARPEEVPDSARELLSRATSASYALGYPEGDANPKGACPECGSRVRLKTTGELYSHRMAFAPCRKQPVTPDGACTSCGRPGVKVLKDGRTLALHTRVSEACPGGKPVSGSEHPDPIPSVVLRHPRWVAVWEGEDFRVAYVVEGGRRRITKITELKEWIRSNEQNMG